MIYFDNASTTKPCEKSVRYLNEYLTDKFFNASSIYKQGIDNKTAITNCKKLIAKTLGVEFKDNVIFTGSATEANNLAILGSVRKNFKKLIFSAGEHPSVYNTALDLQNKGYNVEFVNLNKNGSVDIADFKNKLTPDTSFISIMHVNNETGAINNLTELISIKNRICPNAIFHSDGVQAFGKLKFTLNRDIDLYSISAHKIHGPKGVGALYVKNKAKLNPIVFGGGQEYNLRSGTENVAGIMGFTGAIEEINYNNSVESIKSYIIENLNPNFKVNGEETSPYILSLSYKGINGETLVHMLENEDILISRGSACSGSKVGNRILTAMGLDKDSVVGSIRLSFSRYNTLGEAKIVTQKLNDFSTKLSNL